ncbi:hypothetical protein [Aliikangiella sp. G2MR2-5]|uniref:hypothetical protein n=1 Tax=Aliikangiella sp. G2MR2-5 TaxID=2788943 RepID=UPI0018AAFAF4|nr:hypothetical protein [Aliikangiella sp. G2MR2-5]
MKYSRLIKTSLFALGVTTTSVMAATQGSLGTTSEGDLLISLSVGDLIQINNLNDIALGTFNGGTADLNGSDSFCIYRNGGTGYNVTMSGSGTGGAFELAGGGNTLNYSVSFENLDAGSAAVAMTAGSTLNGVTGANNTDNTCGSAAADNAQVNVNVANADLAAVPPGSYTGTLTILVAPE